MNPSENGRFRVSVSLDADCYAFVERLLAAGVVKSRDELFATALHELARAIEASARRTVLEEGYPDAEDASLEELADMLDQSGQRRVN